ncbi:Holo-[acyl-carrier-protein] synthase [wastewater metagenome]|uniref:Holo-[acyl-carrier-protein] synthase n=2 Tax=unclassified sequences TaxID=12908 RepID=A0A5B8RB12_9ZZZZ|nr:MULTISPECIES: holo-ACP synthase [Arhodomonas]MCS4503623.1 holo-ACP synthase [Arhodomonas aquaeolei]QEA04592.1 holo-[acyl-carrier-protein] synthase [uncultured organism]
MIVGIGTDIVAVARIRRLAGAPDTRFARRVLTAAELDEGAALADFGAFAARRFAAKEAAAKAFGTGIGRGLSFQHLRVGHDEVGAPQLQLEGEAQTLAVRRGILRCHLSISDERDYAVAFVVLEGGSGGGVG